MFNRYANTESINVNSITTYGSYSSYSFMNYPKSSASVLKIGPELSGRPDAIANVVYNDPSLYWVLIEYNNIKDVLNWPKSGEVIKFPPEDIVLRELF